MRIRKIIFVITVLLMLSGCGRVDAEVLSYAEHSFCASVEGEADGLKFAAELQIGAPDERGERNVRLEFLSPQSLRGIVVTRDAQATNVSLDGVSIDNAAADGYLDVARSLIPRGQVVSIKKADDTAIATVALDSKQTIRIDLNTGAPLHAQMDGDRRIDVSVTRFEYIE